jgi:hypothetical protein
MPLRYIAIAQQRLTEAASLLRLAESMRSPYNANYRPAAANRQATVAILALKKAKRHVQAAISRLNGDAVEEDRGEFG